MEYCNSYDFMLKVIYYVVLTILIILMNGCVSTLVVKNCQNIQDNVYRCEEIE